MLLHASDRITWLAAVETNRTQRCGIELQNREHLERNDICQSVTQAPKHGAGGQPVAHGCFERSGGALHGTENRSLCAYVRHGQGTSMFLALISVPQRWFSF